METGFKDPIRSEVKAKEMKSPWDFSCPKYDERSSCYVNAGSHYGVGHKQPIGHAGNPSAKADVLPKGRVSTMKVAGVPRTNLPVEMEK